MLSSVLSSAIHGIDGIPISVEVDFRFGLPAFTIVGLPDAGVRESKERVVAAIKNSGFSFPSHRITVNLAPGHIKKEGPCFDLAIAIGILASAEVIPMEIFESYAFLGELGLDGTLRPVKGVLPCAIQLSKSHLKGIILSEKNAKEAALVGSINVFALKKLKDVVEFLLGEKKVSPYHLDRQSLFRKSQAYSYDFSDVKGQEIAKRALEVAASGYHNVLVL